MMITSDRVRKAFALSSTQFKRLFGVKKKTFGRMLEILHNAFDELRKQGGKPLTKLQVEDKPLPCARNLGNCCHRWMSDG